jgi:hypothetical protein
VLIVAWKPLFLLRKESDMEIFAWILALVGFVFLFFGRPLFWLFAAISGFIFGALVGGFIANDMGTTGIVILGLIVGGLFAVLSIYLQKPMAAVAGFLLGGTIAALLYVFAVTGGNVMFGLPSEFGSIAPVAFLLGGIASAVLVWVTFDWALIIISSLFGALLATPGVLVFLPLPGASALLIPLALAALGIFVQSRLLARPTVVVAPLPPPAPPAPRP